MKTLILAGGLGNRLKPLTNDIPKSLLKVGGEPILGRILDSLTKAAVFEVVFLIGYKAEKIKTFVAEKYPAIKAIFKVDPPDKASKAGYIYSMWQARALLTNDDIPYVHGDVFCDSHLIKKLIDFAHSGALISKNFTSEKDFNARIKDGLISEIGVGVFGEGTGFCLPLYKLVKHDFDLWMGKIGEFVERGYVDCYAETALNEISDKIKFYPVYFEKGIAMEIDDFEDLKKVENYLLSHR